MSDEYKDLMDKLDNPPLSWCPNGVPEGLDPEKCIDSTEIYGKVDEIDDSRVTDFGKFRMVTIEQPNGVRANIAALGMVLEKRLAGIRVGDRIAVRYLGQKPSKTAGQADYHDYLVAVDAAE